LRRTVIMDHRNRHPGNGFLRHIVTDHAINVAVQRFMGEEFLCSCRGGHLREGATTAQCRDNKQKPAKMLSYVLHTCHVWWSLERPECITPGLRKRHFSTL